MWKALAVLMILAAAAEPAAAQRQSGSPISMLKPGTRVRVALATFRKERIIGTITAARPDTVVLDTVDVAAQQRMFMPSAIVVDGYREVGLPARSITRVEISEGKSRARGALKGALRGVLIGGLLVGCAEISGPEAQRKDFTRGLAFGAAAGLAIGVPVGWRTGVERWRPASATTPRMVADR